MKVRPALVEVLNTSALVGVGGVGARSTPDQYLRLMYDLGRACAERDYLCYSGGAEGCDQEFIRGAASVSAALCHLVVPWWSYELSARPTGVSVTTVENFSYQHPEAARIARENHAAWHVLKDGAKKMMIRNVAIPMNTAAVIGWADHSRPGHGGTGHTFRCCMDPRLNVPYWDLANPGDAEEVRAWIKADIKRQVSELHPLPRVPESTLPSLPVDDDDLPF